MYRNRNRNRTETHEKSMGSYELHVWRDAIGLAGLVADLQPITKTFEYFSSLDPDALLEFDSGNAELISEFIQKSESQRPALLRRISKNASDQTIVLFVVMAIIALVRVRATLEIRDRYRTVLAPGRGNRITASALYDFTQEMQDVYDCSWPAEVFEAAEIWVSNDEHEGS